VKRSEQERRSPPGTVLVIRIGLAVITGIGERHGDIVNVESTQGEGSTFCFTHPAGRDANETEGRCPAPAFRDTVLFT